MRTNDLLHDFARNAGHSAILPQVRAWYIHVCTSLPRAIIFLTQVLI
jgi:hypothetical protein